jgi:hydroxymethylbilane synthase
MSSLRLGTRGSPLALYQATAVARRLDACQIRCEIVVIRTSGDVLAEAPIGDAGGKRLFVKEIEDSLLAGEIDLAVHSSKDLPAWLPEGLAIGAVLPREDPRDALILPEGRQVPETDPVTRILAGAPVIGTSSVRRIAQLAGLDARARFRPVRGNLDTRLRKLDAGDYDALVLAAAGLRRLERGGRISALLPVDVCVPSPGQGIIAVEVRRDDRQRFEALMNAIDDPVTALALRAERAVVERLGGGCQMPLGAYAEVSGDRLSVTGIVIALDGGRRVQAVAVGPSLTPEQVGAQAADSLLAQGADRILADATRARSATEGEER